MNASFVSTSWPVPIPTSAALPSSTDATAHHAAFPRMRKTLRLSTQRTKPTNNASALPEAVDNFLRTEYRVDSDFLTNLEFLDRGYDHDEFGDVDNEYDGLTITAPMDEVELFRFCTGYDVL